MSNESDSTQRFFPILELKSLVALFLGLFCILCFKKLIAYGRKWKNILTEWGYRTLNVPYLWISDHFVENHHHDGPDCSLPSRSNNSANFQRLPAIRLPDAWPNFLLTWLYFNVDSMSILKSAWIGAVNESCVRLIGLSAKQHSACSDHQSFHAPTSSPMSYTRLEVKSIQKPPTLPRLSSVDSSASGSTRELHFHCIFTIPEVFLELQLTSRSTIDGGSPDPELQGKSVENYLLHLQQASCRLHMICAALEGDYIRLSWEMISPLLTQPISLLNMNKEPVSQLPSTHVRWIKDTIYLAIQSAVTRVILSPLDMTPVQHSIPLGSQLLSMLPGDQSSNLNQHEASDIPQPLTIDTCNTDLNQPPSTPHGISLNGENTMRLRIVYAVLLEPSSDARLIKSLASCPLYCRVRSNLSLIQSDSGDLAGRASTLMTTSGVRLESKSLSLSAHPSNSVGTGEGVAPQSNLAVNYVAVWNEDAYISLDEITSELLDVMLFTDPDSSTTNGVCLCGHAVLPLPKSDQNSSNKSQHVLLIDCHTGSPTDDWRTTSKQSTDVRAKFMLILQAQMFISSTCSSRSIAPTSNGPVLSAALSSLNIPVKKQKGSGSLDEQSKMAFNYPLHQTTNDKACDHVTIADQVASFMTPPIMDWPRESAVFRSTNSITCEHAATMPTSAPPEGTGVNYPRIAIGLPPSPLSAPPPEVEQGRYAPLMISTPCPSSPSMGDSSSPPCGGATVNVEDDDMGNSPSPVLVGKRNKEGKRRNFLSFRSNKSKRLAKSSSYLEPLDHHNDTHHLSSNIYDRTVEDTVSLIEQSDTRVGASDEQPSTSRLRRLFSRRSRKNRHSGQSSTDTNS